MNKGDKQGTVTEAEKKFTKEVSKEAKFKKCSKESGQLCWILKIPGGVILINDDGICNM